MQFEHLANKLACVVYKPQNMYSNYYLWSTENTIEVFPGVTIHLLLSPQHSRAQWTQHWCSVSD